MKNRWIENKCPMVSNLILISFSHNHPESYHDFPNVSSQPAGGFLSHRGTSSHHPYFNGIFHYEPSILGTPICGKLNLDLGSKQPVANLRMKRFKVHTWLIQCVQ